MDFTVSERPTSRQTTTGKNKSQQRSYVILGVPEAGDDAIDLHAAALAALLATLSSSIVVESETLVRTKHNVEDVNVWDVDASGEPGGTMIWDGSATYERFDYTPPEVGESSYSFDTTGGSQHVTQGLAHIADYPAGSTYDYKGAINVQRNGDSISVEGVDITIPVFSWSETHYIANDDVDDAYKLALFALSGKTNDDTFRGFAAGEVLFLGASDGQRGKENWEITFRFAASLNKTGLTIGTITSIAKKGWEYLWVTYVDVVSTDVVVKQPAAVHIEQVYDAGDFDGLGI